MSIETIVLVEKPKIEEPKVEEIKKEIPKPFCGDYCERMDPLFNIDRFDYCKEQCAFAQRYEVKK